MTARLIMKMRVAEMRDTTPDVRVFTFRHPRRPELPSWQPGAHVDVRLPDGRVRQYSLIGDPADRATYAIAVKHERAGRGGSAWVHDALERGAEAHVSAPRNNFALVRDMGPSVLVGGGIGVTPLVSMARALARDDRTFTFHACARTLDRLPLRAEIEALCGPHLVTWLSGEGRRLDPATIVAPDAHPQLYVCGPPGLVEAVHDAAVRAGVPEAHVHVEVFQAVADESFVPEPFTATIASTGEILDVPADRSLLEVLRAHGLAVPSSCEIGTCGTCVCGYRDGTVIHRDSILRPAERQARLTPCVSRARAAVTLDL